MKLTPQLATVLGVALLALRKKKGSRAIPSESQNRESDYTSATGTHPTRNLEGIHISYKITWYVSNQDELNGFNYYFGERWRDEESIWNWDGPYGEALYEYINHPSSDWEGKMWQKHAMNLDTLCSAWKVVQDAVYMDEEESYQYWLDKAYIMPVEEFKQDFFGDIDVWADYLIDDLEELGFSEKVCKAFPPTQAQSQDDDECNTQAFKEYLLRTYDIDTTITKLIEDWDLPVGSYVHILAKYNRRLDQTIQDVLVDLTHDGEVQESRVYEVVRIPGIVEVDLDIEVNTAILPRPKAIDNLRFGAQYLFHDRSGPRIDITDFAVNVSGQKIPIHTVAQSYAHFSSQEERLFRKNKCRTRKK